MKVSSVIQNVRGNYIRLWVISIFIALLALVPFIYIRQISERVMTSRSWETLFFITAIVIFAILIWTILDHYRGIALHAIGYRVDHELRSHVFNAVHRGNRPEVFRAYGDISQLRSGLTGPLIESAMDASLAPLFILVLFLLHPVFGIIAIVYILIMAILSARSRASWSRIRAEARQNEDRAFAFGVATAGRRETIRAMNILPGVRREWTLLEDRAAEIALAGQGRAGILQSMMEMLQNSLMVIIIGAGAVLYLLDEVTASVGMAAFIVMLRGVGPVVSLARNWPTVYELRAASARLDEVLADDPPEPVSALPAMQGKVTCDNLGVMGADGRPVLTGIRFEVPAGSILGVVGPSGAGKSTLLRMLSGAGRPSTGAVRVDGYPLDTWPVEQLGPQVGYLPQSVDLLPGTIWQNVTRFALPGSVAPEDVSQALRRAGAMDIVQGRGRGLDFVLQDGGAPLSGGQRQRLGLARAFFGTPRLLVLDEPNSALDAEGEKNLITSLTEIRDTGSTVIFSTHKAGMLAICDYVLVVMDGYLHSFSTRDDILDRLKLAGNPLLTRGTNPPAGTEAQA